MDFSKYGKSDSIVRGKNVLVLQNLDNDNTKKVVIELSSVSSSTFDFTEGGSEIYDNLDLTAKIVQACLREYYVNCENATQEAAVVMGVYTPFTITINFVKYHFSDMADFLRRKDVIPAFLEVDVLRYKNICEDATIEAAVKLNVNKPFSISINNTKYEFLNVQDFIEKSLDFFDAEIQHSLFIPKAEVPVKKFSILTSRPFPVINRDELSITSYSINESTRHLTLSPNLLESTTVSYAALDAYIRQDGETVSIVDRPSYNDPTTGQTVDTNRIDSYFKIFEPEIRSPLRNYTPPDFEQTEVNYTVLDPMLRDNLIVAWDDVSKASLTYKVGDVTILDIVQDFEHEREAIQLGSKVLDVQVREHATESFNTEDFNLNEFKVSEATIRNQLVNAYTSLEAVNTNSLVLDPSIRDHTKRGNISEESVSTNNTVGDVKLSKDLHSFEDVSELQTINTVLDPFMIRSLHLNYDEINEVSTTVNIPDPDISGETIVQISCIGAEEQTQDITMNGNFTVYLNDVKLNQQPMSVSTIKTLLAAYGIEIEIISE